MAGTRKARAGGKRAQRFGQLLARLREHRLGKKKSYEQVEQQLRGGSGPLSASTIHRYEREGRIPDAIGLLGLAELYRVDVDHLWNALRADLEGRRMPRIEELIAPVPPMEIEIEGLEEQFVAVDVLADPIAAGPALAIEDAEVSGRLPFTKRMIDKIGAPLCIRVGDFERSMVPTIQPAELVLVDRSDRARERPMNNRIYAVNVPGSGGTLKRVFRLDRGLLLIADNPDKSEYPPLRLEMVRSRWEIRLDVAEADETPAEKVDEDDEVRLWRELIVGEVMWKGQPV